ncbi:GDSL-type esterase/lipase family protein [Psychrobacillus vulpis]|uniref:GDSL family lipase n=1 Tax=Psychrobacillus vulpis TaxID=2325572 RepID=A0A544TTC4_9BACI|nr:GDSL-type esterase/lipase family protein [Psychrobacillus vulpis]TQR20701.1 GDSL family lipase [Psychrobacillus vulpis]
MKYIINLLCIILLSGCVAQDTKTVDFTKKEAISFEEYIIPYTFFPRKLQLVGMGDSLTKGVGDEMKREGYIGRVRTELLQYKGIEDVILTNTALRGRRSDQLLKLLRDGDIDHSIRNADLIMITIGGNDLMKIVKKDLFNLQVGSFDKGLVSFEKNYIKIMDHIREINSEAKIALIGIYNPLSLVTDEFNEFDTIIYDWNKTIESIAEDDENACFISIEKHFDTNANLVYHTDFFHPNGKGYQLMKESIMSSLQGCGFIDTQNRELLF